MYFHENFNFQQDLHNKSRNSPSLILFLGEVMNFVHEIVNKNSGIYEFYS